MPTEPFSPDRLTIDELFKHSLRYRDSKEFFRFFNFIAKFNHYSRYNTMLVYLQDESVTFFGSSTFWKKYNRRVVPDATPYVMLQPFGPVMLAYDIFHTAGVDTPEQFLEKGLGRRPFEVKGTIRLEVLDEAIDAARSLGIKISYKPLAYFHAGYITTIFKGYLEIALKKGMSYEQNLAVLIHELAHLFLGHTGHPILRAINGNGGSIKLMQRKMTRTAEELEAETISFLICKKLGLETRAAEYLAGYIKTDEDLENFSYELVIKTADRIEELFLKKWANVI